MEFTFENLLATNIINFIIVIATLALIFKKAHLGDLIQKMADDIKNDIEKSAISASEALKEYKEVKKSTKDTSKLQEQMMINAKNSANNLKEKIIQETKSQQEEIKANIERILLSQGEKAKKITTSEIYTACVNLAQEIVIQKLDKKTHKKLINSSIDEIDKIKGNLS